MGLIIMIRTTMAMVTTITVTATMPSMMETTMLGTVVTTAMVITSGRTIATIGR